MDKSKAKVIIEKEREVNTYVDMWHTSRCLLYKGIADQKGSYHQFMASLVFTAFALEAYSITLDNNFFSAGLILKGAGQKKN
jgi:hypothetical protein